MSSADISTATWTNRTTAHLRFGVTDVVVTLQVHACRCSREQVGIYGPIHAHSTNPCICRLITDSPIAIRQRIISRQDAPTLTYSAFLRIMFIPVYIMI